MTKLTIFVLMALCSVVSTGVRYRYGERKNWALNKAASQSSTTETYTADRAVDGNNTNGFLDGGSCSQTKQSDKPWWIVSLGAFVVVDEVVLINRGDCCGEELHNFDIVVLKEQMSVVGVCVSHSESLVTGAAVLFPCTKPLLGYQVQIKLREPGRLTLCEVKVFGRPYIAGSKSVNLALGMPAKQSTLSRAGMKATNAVDGVYGGDLLKDRCTQTLADDPNPWWCVDLPFTVKVVQVRIWNRVDCCSDKLRNIYIEVLEHYNEPPKLCAHIIPPAGHVLITDCDQPQIGSVIRIRKQVSEGLRDGEFTLCEVEVRGTRIVRDPIFTKRQDNHALGQKAEQSSTGSYGNAGKAVDSNTHTSVLDHTCSMTAPGDKQQWWKVTFRQTFVEAYAIVLPNYCCNEDTSNYRVWIDDKVQCGSNSNMVPPASIVSGRCPAHTQGTFVTIYKRPTRKYISLCEVEVYGVPPELLNWALGTNAYLSDRIYLDYLVDGDLSNGFGAACPKATSTTSPMTLVVDLGDAHVYVEKILYYTAAGPDAHTTLQDVKIELRDDSKQNVYLGCQPDRVQFPPGFVVTVTCQGTKPQSLANKVTLINGNKVKLVNLCEVEIYGILAFIK